MAASIKTAGIIVELNPLHNGHAAHIRLTRRLTGCTYILAVMSGNFVQRGEPAIIDKWRRTAMALHAGADAVIELPLPYVLGGADYFARGAVSLLCDTGCVQALSFGSECGDIGAIQRGAEILAGEPPAYKKALRAALDKGMSFAAARGAGLAAAMADIPGDSPLFTRPNNALGMEYCKALALRGHPMEVFTTHRGTGGPNATAIRRRLLACAGTPLETAADMPGCAAAILEEARTTEGFVTPDDFGLLFRYAITRRNAPPMEEGLHHRFRKLSHAHKTLNDLLAAAKTKRYTLTRVRRAAMRLVLDTAPPGGDPPYIRVLGFRTQAAALVSEITKHARVPVYTHGASLINPPAMLEKEWEAGDIYRLMQHANALPERRQPLVRV